jgi:hypothetical protein
MNDLAKILWALFLISLTFGIWTIPIVILLVVIPMVVRAKWPDKFDKYF